MYRVVIWGRSDLSRPSHPLQLTYKLRIIILQAYLPAGHVGFIIKPCVSSVYLLHIVISVGINREETGDLNRTYLTEEGTRAPPLSSVIWRLLSGVTRSQAGPPAGLGALGRWRRGRLPAAEAAPGRQS